MWEGEKNIKINKINKFYKLIVVPTLTYEVKTGVAKKRKCSFLKECQPTFKIGLQV